MARSLGDTIASDIGIISTPEITSYHVNPFTDFFLVVASDGVWDVIENDDLVNFVENFRHVS
jgi:serine/threonine protein phosphatase PrpC